MDMACVGELNGKRGRSPSFSEADIQFCLMIQNLYGQALRQARGMVWSLLNLAGLDWDVPDFSTPSRRKQHLQVTLTHQCIDAQTLEIRAIEVTANSIGDAPMLSALLDQIPPEEPVESVGADGA